MEAQLQKRESSKAAIVDLQLKMFINEADGLGFFSEPTNVPGPTKPRGGRCKLGPGSSGTNVSDTTARALRPLAVMATPCPRRQFGYLVSRPP